jgi:hypothetical protein
MKVTKLEYREELVGIKIHAENEGEIVILKRLFEKGAKPNAMNDNELHITFADLIMEETPDDCPGTWCGLQDNRCKNCPLGYQECPHLSRPCLNCGSSIFKPQRRKSKETSKIYDRCVYCCESKKENIDGICIYCGEKYDASEFKTQKNGERRCPNCYSEYE